MLLTALRTVLVEVFIREGESGALRRNATRARPPIKLAKARDTSKSRLTCMVLVIGVTTTRAAAKEDFNQGNDGFDS